MTEEDLKLLAAHSAALAERLGKSPYAGCRSTLDSALENLDYFVQPASISLAGARYWIVQAQKELDQMHKALVAAEALAGS